MSRLIMVTGGARSGKSNFAESIAKDFGSKVLYIATAVPFDDEMKDRIKKHRQSRPEDWDTLEAYKDFEKLLPEAAAGKECILLDCITVMITNILFEVEIDFGNVDNEKADAFEAIIKNEVEKLLAVCSKLDKTIIFVSNEIGMGIVPDNAISRIFRDIAGRMNQVIAKACNEVYVCISGIPLKIK